MREDHDHHYEVMLKMGDNKSIYKREAYTLLSLLGDFGGFADALTLLIGLLSSFYSARMFTTAIAAELPYSNPGNKRNQISSKHQNTQNLKGKVERNLALSEADLNVLKEAIKTTK